MNHVRGREAENYTPAAAFLRRHVNHLCVGHSGSVREELPPKTFFATCPGYCGTILIIGAGGCFYYKVIRLYVASLRSLESCMLN